MKYYRILIIVLVDIGFWFWKFVVIDVYVIDKCRGKNALGDGEGTQRKGYYCEMDGQTVKLWQLAAWCLSIVWIGLVKK
jgi:hypothetical protein